MDFRFWTSNYQSKLNNQHSNRGMSQLHSPKPVASYQFGRWKPWSRPELDWCSSGSSVLRFLWPGEKGSSRSLKGSLGLFQSGVKTVAMWLTYWFAAIVHGSQTVQISRCVFCVNLKDVKWRDKCKIKWNKQNKDQTCAHWKWHWNRIFELLHCT